MPSASRVRAAVRRRALAAALLVPCLAQAQDAPAHEEPAGQYGEEIEVEGHSEKATGSSEAASAGKISRQLVEDRPILRPGEVLELVPGLIITQHSGAGKANQYFLRGFNLDHGTDFLTTLDGMPVNLRSHAHGQGYTDLNFLIPELVQRVDYFKGPYSASKGDFASAGAADIHYDDSLPDNLVRLTGGSWLYGRALFAGSPQVGAGKLLYGAELQHEDGPWDRPDDYRRVNGVLRYSSRPGDARWALTAMGHGGVWNGTDQVPLRAVQAGQIDRFGTLDGTTGGRTNRFSLSGDYQQPLGDAFLRANLYAVKYRLDLFSNFTYQLRDAVSGDQFEQLDDRWVFGTSGNVVWSAPDDAPLHAAAGWEARHDRIDPVALYHTVERRRLSTTRQDFVRETSAALYAEAGAAPLPWLKLIGGLRYDQFFFDVASDAPENSGRHDAGRLSPKLSAILGPWGRTEVFANFGLGFHSNDARGVTTTIDPATGKPVSRVTPLVPTRGAEAGVRTAIVPGLQASLALWRLEMDSELRFSGDAGTTEASRASRRWGIEGEAAWRPIRWLLVDLNAAWSHARFTSADPDPAIAGDHIPGAIESTVSAAVTLHEIGPFSGSAYVRYFGPRPLTEDGGVRSRASTLLNAQATWKMAPWASAMLEVFNVFDAQVDDIAYFYRSRLPGEPSAGVAGVHFHPAERRSARVSGSLRF